MHGFRTHILMLPEDETFVGWDHPQVENKGNLCMSLPPTISLSASWLFAEARKKVITFLEEPSLVIQQTCLLWDTADMSAV